MTILSLSDRRASPLRRLRRRTWMLIALCLFARAADAALGLNLIEHTQTVAAQQVRTCTAAKEPSI